ncbi:nitrogen fixation protein NifQ [Poseidonocella sp. HB161398]|uniref:nitrogen fixation protein NifQ n=1 Tax=Poseidonocella sp. HB161398 TaxID=2320855 RepID=UPI001F0F141E|nr:nitrogen fixation protein NifQ [Poseidonocella sp. HB161398]
MRLSTPDIRVPAGMQAERMLISSDFACIFDHALKARAAGKGTLPELLGLPPAALEKLAARWFPYATLPDLDAEPPAVLPDQEAIAKLLLWRGGRIDAETQWLAAIIARRAMETSHLWEDLGLAARPALSALMRRHFPRLFEANSQNMRWKKFFYRQICADKDFALCLSPTCDDCPEYSDCFAPSE